MVRFATVTSYLVGVLAFVAGVLVLGVAIVHLAAAVPQAPLAVISAAALLAAAAVSAPVTRRRIESRAGTALRGRRVAATTVAFVATGALSFVAFFLG